MVLMVYGGEIKTDFSAITLKIDGPGLTLIRVPFPEIKKQHFSAKKYQSNVHEVVVRDLKKSL